MFLVQKNVLYNISKVSVGLVRVKCFFVTSYNLKTGFSVAFHLVIIQQTTQVWY